MKTWTTDAEVRDMLQNEINEITATMDIPTKRRELSQSNLEWLGRNAFIHNRNHADFDALAGLLTLLDISVYKG